MGEMPSGEDSRLYFILTKDLGFIMAIATGVRLLKSKLRFQLSTFAYIDLELVRGKNIWRIVNAYQRENNMFFKTPRADIFARLSLLVRRMVHGEEENGKLFEEILETRKLLSEEKFSPAEADQLELVSVARILSSLGYFDGRGKYEEVLTGRLSRGILPKAAILRGELVRDINSALKESQL